MTSLSRAGLLVAIVAALLGAPSAVLAAPPNALSNASVQPGGGSTATTFTFRVHYSSRAGNPAGTVTVSVGARTLRMNLLSGSTTDGTYQLSATLTEGSWTPVFRASPARGPQPSLNGPLIRVAALSTPVLTPQPTPRPEPNPSAAPTISVVEPPDRSPAPTNDAAPGRFAGGGTSTPPAEPQPPKHPGSSEMPGDAPAPRGGKSSSDEPVAAPSDRQRGGNASRPSPGAAPIGGIKDPWGGSGLPSISLLMVVFGVAAAALLTFFWFLLGRRRRNPQDEAAAAAAAATHGAEAVSQRIAERAARRQRLDPSDDPIVAALGLPKRGDRGKRPAAGQVHAGPGERPIATRRSRRR